MAKSTGNLRPCLNMKLYPDDVKSDKWTIIFFDKKGKSYNCRNDIFDSEDAANMHMKSALSWPNGVRSIINGVIEWALHSSEISHAVPMPVK